MTHITRQNLGLSDVSRSTCWTCQEQEKQAIGNTIFLVYELGCLWFGFPDPENEKNPGGDDCWAI